MTLRFIELSQNDWEPDLSATMSLLPGFSTTFTVDEPTHMTISGHVDYKRRQISALGDNATFAAHIIRCDGADMPGSKTGDNIPNHAKHYCVLPCHGYKLLQPGEHTVELWARSDSSAAPGVNGQCEVKMTYNGMLIRLESA